MYVTKRPAVDVGPHVQLAETQLGDDCLAMMLVVVARCWTWQASVGI